MEMPTNLSFADWSSAQVFGALGALAAGTVVREAWRLVSGLSEVIAVALGKLKDKAITAIGRW